MVGGMGKALVFLLVHLGDYCYYAWCIEFDMGFVVWKLF